MKSHTLFSFHTNQPNVEEMEIVEKSVAEISVLDVKMVNVIRLIRSELELPFDEDHYLQVIHSSHEKLRGSLHEFQDEWSDEHEQA